MASWKSEIEVSMGAERGEIIVSGTKWDYFSIFTFQGLMVNLIDKIS